MWALSRVAVVLFTASCTNFQSSSEELVGIFSFDNPDADFRIELKSDGSYEELLFNGTSVRVGSSEEFVPLIQEVERGRWSAAVGTVVLSSDEGSVRVMDIIEDGEMVTLQEGSGRFRKLYRNESNKPVQETPAKPGA